MYMIPVLIENRFECLLVFRSQPDQLTVLVEVRVEEKVSV